MQSSALQCPVCLDNFNLVENLPRMLKQCGHTVCTKCIQNLLRNSDFRCPLDKKRLPGREKNIDAFPINFTVRQLVEETSPWETCKAHGNKMEFICETDKLKICAHCALFDGHKDHKLKHMSEYQPKLDVKKSELEAILKGIDEYHKETKAFLDEIRSTLHKTIDNQIEDQIFALRMMKQGILFDLNSLFKREKDKLDATCGRGSPLRDSVKAKMDLYQDSSKGQDIFKLLEEDLSQYTTNFDSELLKKVSQDLKDKLNEVSDKFNNRFTLKAFQTTDFENLSQLFTEDLKTVYFTANILESLSLQAGTSTEPLQITSPLSFSVSEGSLDIAVTNNRSKSQSILLDKWKDLKEVKLTMQAFPIREEDAKTLDTILASLSQITSITLIVKHRVQFTEEDLFRVFSTIFCRVQNLEKIELNFRHSKTNGELISLMLSKVLTRVSNIKAISLDLAETTITNRAFNGIIKTMKSSMKNIDRLKLNLSDTLVTEELLIDMLVNVPDVQDLMLELDNTELTSKGLATFVEQRLMTMTRLEAIKLGLNDIHVTDESVSQLLNELPDLKSLQIELEDNKLSDKAFEKFVGLKLASMKKLTQLRVELDGTQVSSNLRDQIRNFLKNEEEERPVRGRGRPRRDISYPSNARDNYDLRDSAEELYNDDDFIDDDDEEEEEEVPGRYTSARRNRNQNSVLRSPSRSRRGRRVAALSDSGSEEIIDEL